MIRRRIASELPFMATENLLMAMVTRGADRQDVHERIRVHSLAAAAGVKERGEDNDLLDRVRNDSAFAAIHADLDGLLDPRTFVGRAPEQTRAFVELDVQPALARWADKLANTSDLRV